MSKVQIGILWGTAIAVILVFLLLGRFLSKSPQEGVPAMITPAQVYNLPSVPFSARQLYPRAEQAARSWHSDATLVSATASWRFVTIDDLSRPIDWTFQFYSPSTRRIYVVSVNDQQATPIRDALTPYELAGLPPESWQVDSYQALGTWLTWGGARFLRANPVADVNARLRMSAAGRPEWVIVGVADKGQTIHLLQIDARTGKVER